METTPSIAGKSTSFISFTLSAGDAGAVVYYTTSNVNEGIYLITITGKIKT
jgi:hypothetical protein